MVFTFSLDKYLNKYIPRSQVKHFPGPLRRLLGGFPASATHDYYIWLEILVASFCGIALLAGVFQSHTAFTAHHAHNIVASYAATAILCFNASQVPLAQPRNIFTGHFLASLIGVCIEKLFSLSAGGRDNYWAAAALSVAVASVAMSICNCVHPPAGASAMLPSIDENIRKMGWWYLPVQLVSSLLIIPVACIFGNVFRRYPVYWWTPGECGLYWKKEEKKEPEKAEPSEVESLATGKDETASESPAAALAYSPQQEPETQIAPVPSHSSARSRWSHRLAHTASRKTLDEGTHTIVYVPGLRKISVTADEIMVPAELDLDDISLDWLRSMRMELKSLSDLDESSPV
ncbi:hypothetical protein FDK38_001862 [Candidozyma auris]|nr:hypothetical protein FDK38_001862 [[Candida] auris]